MINMIPRYILIHTISYQETPFQFLELYIHQLSAHEELTSVPKVS